MLKFVKPITIFLIYDAIIALLLSLGSLLLMQNNGLYYIWGIYFFVPFTAGIYSLGFGIIVGAITKRINNLTIVRSLIVSIIIFIILYFTMWISRIQEIQTHGLFSYDNLRIMIVPSLTFAIIYFITTLLVKTARKYKQ